MRLLALRASVSMAYDVEWRRPEHSHGLDEELVTIGVLLGYLERGYGPAWDSSLSRWILARGQTA